MSCCFIRPFDSPRTGVNFLKLRVSKLALHNSISAFGAGVSTWLPLRVTANTGNVALRVPEAPICRSIVRGLGLPITATSANLRGLPECTYANCVREQFGDKIPLIVDGGPTSRTVPTTIVDLSGGPNSWMILREGAIPTHEIALALHR